MREKRLEQAEGRVDQHRGAVACRGDALSLSNEICNALGVQHIRVAVQESKDFCSRDRVTVATAIMLWAASADL